MINLKQTLLATGLILGATFSASAIELISPTEAATTKVTSLGTITLKWSEWTPEEPPTLSCTLLDADGTQVATGAVDFNFADYAWYDVTFSPTITDPGLYTVVVPEDLVPGGSPAYRLPFEIASNDSTPAEPSSITPENGAVIVQDSETATEFNSIIFNFDNDPSLTVNFDLITLTNDKGDKIQYETSGWWEAGSPMLEMMGIPMVRLNFNDEGLMPSGIYTLNVKPGAFTSPRGTYMEEITYTYDYTRTKAEADDTPLEILSAMMGGAIVTYDAGVPSYNWDPTDATEVTPDMYVSEFVGSNDVPAGEPATGFLLTFNHGEKSNYVPYELKDVDTNEILVSGQARKLEDNSFLVGWASTTKLVEGTHYALEFRAYNNIQEKVPFGDVASLTFIGASEAYKYSPAKFITTVPSDGSTLYNRSEAKITVLYSQPVKMTASYSIGMGAGTVGFETESASGKEYDNVWYATLPDDLLDEYPNSEINFKAYDENGLIVAGNSGGVEENSTNVIFLQFTFCQPRVLLGQTNSHVSKLDTFTITSSKDNAINPSWNDNPYIIDATGKTVATLNQDYYNDPQIGMTAYKVLRWSSSAQDAQALEQEFQMIPPVTKKGKYTLVFPQFTYNFGDQFTGETSIEQTFDFYVVDFFPVNYTVDNCTVALSDVEFGKSATIAVTPAEGWKLESLTLNGNDVTKDVTAGNYTSPAATSEMNFAATFAFDGITVTPTGVDDVVTDLKLRGWSQDGKLFVAGLKKGQVVSVFTAGGALMHSTTVADLDTLEIDVPAGVYIVTVAEGANKVALKLVNK